MKFCLLVRHVIGVLVLFPLLQGCNGSQTYTIQTETMYVDSLQQIVLLEDSLVKPILYTNINGLDALPFHQAKKKFISAILPSILVAKHQVQTTKTKMIWLQQKKVWSEMDSTF